MKFLGKLLAETQPAGGNYQSGEVTSKHVTLVALNMQDLQGEGQLAIEVNMFGREVEGRERERRNYLRLILGLCW